MAAKKKLGFDALVKAFARDSEVELPEEAGGGFGSAALKVGGKIFAMQVSGQLVVKLPRARVEALIADGDGGPFSTGGARVMKEWVVVTADEAAWLALAREAKQFVGGGTRPRTKR